jgi:hypothetical protein
MLVVVVVRLVLQAVIMPVVQRLKLMIVVYVMVITLRASEYVHLEI